MSSSSYLITWLIIVSVANAVNVSYNRPELCPNATWDLNGTTIAGVDIIGEQPHRFFINYNNNIYVAAGKRKTILKWLEGNNESEVIADTTVSKYSSLFVTINGDIYFEKEGEKGQIYKWINSTNHSTPVADFEGHCHGLFIDINNTIYCSVHDQSKVISTSLNDNYTNFTIVAGSDRAGSSSHELRDPHGIFVDINFTIYVADTGNGRIQRFRSGQKNGTTVAGCGFPRNLELRRPIDVVLDANDNLFIVEHDHNRIVRVGPSDFQHILGYKGPNKESPVELNRPYSIRFDSSGNIYVADTDSHRIQKFTLATNSCESTTNVSSTFESITTSSCFTQAESPDQTTTTIQEQTTTVSNAPINTYLSIEEIVTTTSSNSTQTENLTTTTITDPTTTVSNALTNTYGSTEEIGTTTSLQSYEQLPNIFYPHACEDSTEIGSHCNVSNAPCNQLQPCLNNGTCYNNDTNVDRYFCLCLEGFNGTECQLDFRVCKSDTCFNDGTCLTLNATFNCSCKSGWEGKHCEHKISHCLNVTCENNGICRPLLLNYTCECLGNFYSGRHCEITATKIIIYKIISKSFAYIAIIAMVSVMIFIIVMDVLKYFFGIDLTREEREQIRRKKHKKKRNRPTGQLILIKAPGIADKVETKEETVV
ncbi:unnamed protein product [Adineta steineri]|uniref:EGF-like domain-containing protein n=1 Tax=Adineta steineri TaxID=433720 RepID=A0A814AVV4_9BILA|nr:unnamed protein product [Adineta steineri]CAF0983039.1 unnamed protein product [Adineta steineri]